MNQSKNNDKKNVLKRVKSRKCIKNFNGSENVKYFPAKSTDFKLPVEDHVAKYNCDLLSLDWNEHHTTQRMLTKIYRTFVHGLPGRLCPIILEFLVVFYIFNYLRIQYGCVPTKFDALFSNETVRNNDETTKSIENKCFWFVNYLYPTV